MARDLLAGAGEAASCSHRGRPAQKPHLHEGRHQRAYLQFLLFILLTVWLLQKGSPESKELGQAGRESDRDQKVGVLALADSPSWARAGGWRLRIYSRSLGFTMGAICEPHASTGVEG